MEAFSIIREAANCDDVQINFGVILNESLADAVKISVIATGSRPRARRCRNEVRSQARLREHATPPWFRHRPYAFDMYECTMA